MHFCNILLVTQVGPAYSVGMGSIKGEKPKKGGDHMRPLWRRGTSAVCRWHQNYYIFLIWTVIDEGRAGALELLRLVFESQFQHLLHYLSLVTQFFQTSVFPSTIWRKYWIFLRLLSKISCDLSSTPANGKCSMMALLLRLLRAVIRIIGLIVWSQITMIWGDQYLGTDLALVQMTVSTLWFSIDETSLIAFNWRKQIRKSLEMPQPPKPI